VQEIGRTREREWGGMRVRASTKKFIIFDGQPKILLNIILFSTARDGLAKITRNFGRFFFWSPKKFLLFLPAHTGPPKISLCSAASFWPPEMSSYFRRPL
jgi:hypothetical protein